MTKVKPSPRLKCTWQLSPPTMWEEASQHSLVCHFMKGARRLLHVSRPLVPPWDLAVVLEGRGMHPIVRRLTHITQRTGVMQITQSFCKLDPKADTKMGERLKGIY